MFSFSFFFFFFCFCVFFCTASKRQRVCFHCFAFLDCIKKRRVGYLLSRSCLGGCPICFNPAYIRLVSLAAWDMIWMKHVYMISLLLLQHWWMKDGRHNGESVTHIVCLLPLFLPASFLLVQGIGLVSSDRSDG